LKRRVIGILHSFLKVELRHDVSLVPCISLRTPCLLSSAPEDNRSEEEAYGTGKRQTPMPLQEGLRTAWEFSAAHSWQVRFCSDPHFWRLGIFRPATGRFR